MDPLQSLLLQLGVFGSNPEIVSALKIGIFLDNDFNNNISWPDNLESEKKGKPVHNDANWPILEELPGFCIRWVFC